MAQPKSNCVAAIEMMRQAAFLSRAERIGTTLRETLDAWKSRHPLIGDVRGLEDRAHAREHDPLVRMNPVVVLGASGKTGRRVVERLRARNVPDRLGSVDLDLTGADVAELDTPR